MLKLRNDIYWFRCYGGGGVQSHYSAENSVCQFRLFALIIVA